ncbi:sigma-70 family RNA polymerase sigma factor [Sphingomonas parva]|uniref:Sigma-70 family RNA polymerase sigma factor n=1 Tax=Sphingomonas parva TaxID=2555898 RepID=A0A4Y8ZPE9_9SPHN|nr:sigma-70 family RNA polymerase sigma factor [Sphingomonas parva]TFI56709.1 sigma-70 family RNA polymerase sigma factor [Sphingomonas parva]
MLRSQVAARSAGDRELDEAALVERLRGRDVRAFEQLYRAYHGRISRFLLNMMRRPHLVEEVVDDVMMVVWNRIGDFHGASRLSTWMFGIAYRQGLSALRRFDDPIEDPRQAGLESGEPSPEQSAGADRSRRALGEAIDRLSPAHRAVVNLTYFQGFGYREVAEILDCPIDTVKTRMFHARRHLKRALPGDLADWI